MKNVLIIFLFLGGLFGPPTNLEQANKDHEEKRYAASITAFEAALDEYPLKSQSIRYNIGQNQMAMDSLPKAMDAYERTFDDKDLELTSMAHNNKGVVQTRMAEAMQKAMQQQQQAQQQQAGPAAGSPNLNPQQMQQIGEQSSMLLKAAMETFKEAMRKYPDNEQARFNYELLKRRLEKNQQDQKQDQQNQDQNQDQDQQDQEEQDQDDQQQNQKEQQQKQKQKKKRKPKEGKGEKAEYSDIPEGMEEKVLKAMEDKEKQFIQELRKSTKKKDRKTDGPDW